VPEALSQAFTHVNFLQGAACFQVQSRFEIPDLLCGTFDVPLLARLLFGAARHVASPWLDLAEGRLRLDRPSSMTGLGHTLKPRHDIG
jgi:hypothetical protein